jgi:death-on-curing protein
MIKNFYAYFDINHAIQTHELIIARSGGFPGVKNKGYIESVLENIQNDDYYPDLASKLNHLVHSTIMFHAFHDGNKRASIALGSYFLELNAHGARIKKFTQEMENIVVWVAENKINKTLLGELIESILYEDDYSEELKLRFIAVIS